MSPAEARLDLDALRRELHGPLERALAGVCGEIRVDYLCEPKDVEDDPAKLLISDERGHPVAVVLVSSPVEPDLVGRGMRIAHEARERLGSPLANVILEPFGEGTLRELSYTILPYRRPLGDGRISTRFWRLVLRRRVLDWVAGVSEATAREVAAGQVDAAFTKPLEHLAELDTMDAEIREAAAESRSRLARTGWKPQSVFMHGDLWEDNLLRASGSTGGVADANDAPFVVIDWPGATMQGYPFYDLLRIARSMRLSAAGLRNEVRRHRRILDLDSTGAMGHLLAGLGHIGLNLGCFPMDMYVDMSRNCFVDLRSALDGESD
jgi:hypothetical protein